MSVIFFTTQEEEAFRNAREESFENLPDGEYNAILKSVTAKLVGKDRVKKLLLTYSVTWPHEHEGARHTQFLPLDNPKAYGYLKFVLRRFSIETKTLNLSDVETQMQQFEGHEVILKLVTEGQYQNTHVVTIMKPDNKEDIPF